MKHNIDRLRLLMADNQIYSPDLLNYFVSLESTNNWLADAANMQSDIGNGIADYNHIHGMSCLAEHQSAGKGRRGRQWQSGSSASILLSLGWDLSGQSPAGLSLVCGLAVAVSLEALGVTEVKLKWPNDIYLDDRKLGGILIEILSGHCVIGMGLNVNLPNELVIDQPWVDLKSMGYEIDRDELVGALIRNHEAILTQFTLTGFMPFQAQWNSVDVFSNKRVRVESPDQQHRGIARGVDHHGALLLDCDGKIQSIFSGEVSLRQA